MTPNVIEHDFEPIRGLPGDLPAGERLLWQGAPDWRAVAVRVYHLRPIAIYFGLLMVWRGATSLSEGASLLGAVQSSLWAAPVALLALGLLAFLAWLTARTTVYSITNRRIVLRFGVALTKAINIPFAIIDSAAMKTWKDGSGDVTVLLKAPNKIPVLQLWPHMRPWRINNPEPALRSIPRAQEAASILAEALKAHLAEHPVAEAVTSKPRPTPARRRQNAGATPQVA
jgi:hypothetical protein